MDIGEVAGRVEGASSTDARCLGVGEVAKSIISELAGSVEGVSLTDPIHAGEDAKPVSPKAKACRRRKHISSQDVEIQPVRRSARIASRASVAGASARASSYKK